MGAGGGGVATLAQTLSFTPGWGEGADGLCARRLG